MKLLAIETATDICGIALTENNQMVAEYLINEKNIHNEKLVTAVQSLTKEVKWSLNELNGIALVIGPGSFTGLRIGLAFSKGLAFSLEIPLVGVNTLDAMANGALFWCGPICTILKARADEVYFALYKKKINRLQRISDYQILHIDSLYNQLKEKTLIISYPQNMLNDSDSDEIVKAPAEHIAINPFVVAQIGYVKMQNNETENLDSLEPFYLKEFTPKRKVYYNE